MKTYIVTGGAGFIGSHLSETLLNEGHTVISIDNFNDFYNPNIKHKNIEKIKEQYSNFSSYNLDFRNKNEFKEVVKKEKPLCIIHLAAMAGVRPSIEDPELYTDVNIRGTQNIFEVCTELGIKNVVFASSSSVYGVNKKIPFSEDDQVDAPISPYAMTKKQNELMAHLYHHLYGINMVGLRFFTVYGARQRPDLAIHKFTKMIDNGEPIPFFGDGSTRRDYTYINDIIDGVIKAIDYCEQNENVYDIFNLGESETTTLKQLVEEIEMSLGKKAIINRLPMQSGDVPITFADISKSKKILGYAPKTKIKEGIPKFVAWYKNNKSMEN